MVKSCVVCGCSSVYNPQKKISFFGFPLNRPEILERWIQAIRREDWKPSKNSKLCSQHFLPSDFVAYPAGYSKRSLLPHAIPSVFSFLKHLRSKDVLPRKIMRKQLPNDMENYTEYHLMGSVSQVRMREGCLPTKFGCPPNGKEKTGEETTQPLAVKRPRWEITAECERELAEAQFTQSIFMAEAQPGPSSVMDVKQELDDVGEQKIDIKDHFIPLETIKQEVFLNENDIQPHVIKIEPFSIKQENNANENVESLVQTFTETNNDVQPHAIKIEPFFIKQENNADENVESLVQTFTETNNDVQPLAIKIEPFSIKKENNADENVENLEQTFTDTNNDVKPYTTENVPFFIKKDNNADENAESLEQAYAEIDYYSKQNFNDVNMKCNLEQKSLKEESGTGVDEPQEDADQCNQPSTSYKDLPLGAKQIVLNVYNGLSGLSFKLPKSEALKETAFLTKIPQSTVYSIVEEEIGPGNEEI